MKWPESLRKSFKYFIILVLRRNHCFASFFHFRGLSLAFSSKLLGSFLLFALFSFFSILYLVTLRRYVKAVFFGNVIAVLGCYYGLHSPDGAEGVGKATTKTVVSSIIVIFILNAVLTFVLY